MRIKLGALTFLNVFNALSLSLSLPFSRNDCKFCAECFVLGSFSLAFDKENAHANATNRNHIYLVDSL